MKDCPATEGNLKRKQLATLRQTRDENYTRRDAELQRIKEDYDKRMEDAEAGITLANALPEAAFGLGIDIRGNEIYISSSALEKLDKALEKLDKALALLPPAPLKLIEQKPLIQVSDEQASNIAPLFLRTHYIPPPEGPETDLCWFFELDAFTPVKVTMNWSAWPTVAAQVVFSKHGGSKRSIGCLWDGTPAVSSNVELQVFAR